jgi:hypothetical protein
VAMTVIVRTLRIVRRLLQDDGKDAKVYGIICRQTRIAKWWKSKFTESDIKLNTEKSEDESDKWKRRNKQCRTDSFEFEESKMSGRQRKKKTETGSDERVKLGLFLAGQLVQFAANVSNGDKLKDDLFSDVIKLEWLDLALFRLHNERAKRRNKLNLESE